MARVKLRCIMGCPGLKSSYSEKGLLSATFSFGFTPEAATGGVLRTFAKFTGKHPWQSLFLNKVAGLRPTILF